MSTADLTDDAALSALHASLDARHRPEDVAVLILRALAGRLGVRERMKLGAAARAAGRWGGWSSMGDDFARPVGGAAQAAATTRLFQVATPAALDVDDPASLLGFAADVGRLIGAAPQRLDFLQDRLNRNERAAAGLEVSKRQYNRRFRALQRLTAKARRLDRASATRRLTLIARVGFAGHVTRDRFLADTNAACFVAYYTARRKVRRQFTLSGRDNPYDEIADMLFQRCLADPRTDWWMIAQAYGSPQVLARLDDGQRGELLGRWWATMRQVADLLAQVWAAGEFDRATMVVRKGDDSSTWNLLCGAYNAARAAWLSCLVATGGTDLLDVSCPGKAMMLIAGDLAAWHRSTGGGLHPDVGVWARLPLPWDVLAGRDRCTREDVIAACADSNLDPARSGWTAPRPPGTVAAFTPTPELVHGVSIADPVWATLLRDAGVFSGKRVRADHLGALSHGVPTDVVISDLPRRPQSDGRDPAG